MADTVAARARIETDFILCVVFEQWLYLCVNNDSGSDTKERM